MPTVGNVYVWGIDVHVGFRNSTYYLYQWYVPGCFYFSLISLDVDVCVCRSILVHGPHICGYVCQGGLDYQEIPGVFRAHAASEGHIADRRQHSGTKRG